MNERSYGPNMDFGYVYAVTLTFEILPWVKVKVINLNTPGQ